MFLPGDLPVYAESLVSRLQSIPSQLLEGLEPCAATLEFERSSDLNACLPENQLLA